MTAIPSSPAGQSRSIFGDGAKPSFLSGAVWAGLASLILLPSFFGDLQIQTALPPVDLQVHETLFGYLAAIVAGFVLTAIPGWTGRPPLAARTLGLLVVVWLAGRVAMAASGFIGPFAAGGVDSLFLLLAAAIALREAASGRAASALAPIGLLVAFYAGSVVFDLGAYHNGSSDAGKRIAIAAVVMLVTVVGGRVLPRPGTEDQPPAFGALDIVTVAVSAVALLVWIALPAFIVTGALLLIAGIVHAVRLFRWVSDRKGQNTLTLVQQIAYGFIPLGFLVLGLGDLSPHGTAAGVDIRSWLVSATAILTLGTVARISLDPAGSPAAARRFAWIIYSAIGLAAVGRLIGGLSWVLPAIGGAALVVAFAVFSIGYLPLLARPAAAVR
nr:NnrS family protein [uncultured Rhodopila sp.]